MTAPYIAVGPYSVAANPTHNGTVVAPTRRMVKRVHGAVLAVDDDVAIERLLPRGADILYGWVATIPGTHDRAAGYTVNKRTLMVRSGMADAPDLTAENQMAVILHESLGHVRLAQVPLSLDQMDRAIKLLAGAPVPAYNDPREVWRAADNDQELADAVNKAAGREVTSAYWFRIFECVIDSVVPALSDVVTSWHGKYRRFVPQANYPALKALWLEGLTQPVAAPPDQTDSEPIPAPPNDADQIAALEAALDQLHANGKADATDAATIGAAASRIVARHAGD